MFNKQLRFQRILAFVMLALSALTIVYALGFMTDIYRLLFRTYDPDKEGSKYSSPYPTVTMPDGTERTVTGGKLFYDMQDFNRTLLVCAIVVLLVCLANFITNGQKRRNYYIGNYMAVGLISVTNIVVSVVCMSGIADWRAKYLTEVDFEALKVYCGDKYYYTDSTLWFDMGFVMFAVLLVATALLVANMVWKILLMNKEKQMLNGGEVAA